MKATGALHYLGIEELARLIREQKVSPVEVVQAYLDRIDALDGRLKSFITVLREESLGAAQEAEREIRRGRYLGPMHGIPVALKDLIYTRDVLTTGGSNVLREYAPDHDATLVERFRQAGAIIIGKLNLHEFAMGGVDGNEWYGIVRNPWDESRFAGSSSGGSGAAVAAGLCAGAMGTDTGGSIRGPAHNCGIVGLKPTYGRVSRYGVMVLSWSLDHVGPMARTVGGCAFMLQAIAGHDPRDPTSARVPVPDYAASLTGDVRGVRLGLMKEFFTDEFSSEVRSAVQAALDTLQRMGAVVTEVSVPWAKYTGSLNTVISNAEGAAYHHQGLLQHRSEYGSNPRARLELGAVVPAGAYLKGQRLRRAFAQRMDQLLTEVDILASPMNAIVSHPIGATTVAVDGRQVAIHKVRSAPARPANLAGLPAISLPCGFSSDGLPIGLQMVGRAFDEATVLRVAHAYEQATDWHRRQPVP